MAILLILSCCTDNREEETGKAVPPQVDREGIRTIEKPAFDEEDVIAAAKTLWGEARGCSYEGQVKVVWVICNRVDAGFGDSIKEVCAQPYQFHGYSPDYPVEEELYAIALDVLTRWQAEKRGETVNRELPGDYLWFSGDGKENHFRNVY